MRAALGRAAHKRVRTAAGLLRTLRDHVVDAVFVRMAYHWRPRLAKPVFIGVAGSAGKTTTKELLLGVLSHKGRGIGNYGSYNGLRQVAKTILRVRPTHDFCVAELSEDAPGLMDAPLALLQPRIGIVTVIGNDHWGAFHSRTGIADEVSKLVASLPAAGTAVLNADDELVLAMATSCAAHVITYGISPSAGLRAEDISSTWPDRLALTLACGTERVRMDTQLCGAHWVPAILAATGAGLATGLSLAWCADGIATVVPVDGRMEPVATSNGVTFIRDDFKAPLWTVDACFAFMKAARAKRKIIVIGTLSDCGAGTAEKYAKVAKRAQDIADMTIFIGHWAPSVLKARKPGAEHALRVFGHVRDAAEYINSHTREGDLVLLKGTNKQDHLFRIILTRSRNVACWRDDCNRLATCNACPDIGTPSGVPPLMDSTPVSSAAPHAPPPGRAVNPHVQIIVGLGNPESRYAGTPHNIGYQVVDRIAVSLSLVWDTTREGWIARGSSQGRDVCLVKIQLAMNHTGAGLKRLSDHMAFGPEQCILVHDDLHLPLGDIRTRLSGGAGGHRGVASILEAFQTDAFRRVKVGVGQPGATLNRMEYVLTAFDATSQEAADLATSAAVTRALEMVERLSVEKQP